MQDRNTYTALPGNFVPIKDERQLEFDFMKEPVTLGVALPATAGYTYPRLTTESDYVFLSTSQIIFVRP